MKKITLILLLTIVSQVTYAQTLTTGVVNATGDSSFEFQINTVTNVVTLTMNFPVGRWFGLAPNVAGGNSMGNTGDDVVIYSANGLEDRNMTGGLAEPNLDASQNWTLVSDSSSGSVITVVATRNVDTGDSDDFIFPTMLGASFPVLFARSASGDALAYHGSSTTNAGAVMVTLQNTLSSDEFEESNNDIIVFTTPEDRNNINIRLNEFIVNNNIELEIFNIIGNKMYTQNLRGQDITLSIGLPNLTSGVYIARLNFEGKQLSRKFFVY